MSNSTIPISETIKATIKEIEESFDLCPRCKCCSMIWMECHNCEDGYSGHDCGEDCCCCADPEDNVVCNVCHGKGGWWACAGACDENGKHTPLKVENEVS